jgi:hypothetical protein
MRGMPDLYEERPLSHRAGWHAHVFVGMFFDANTL